MLIDGERSADPDVSPAWKPEEMVRTVSGVGAGSAPQP
jgi:hypothetical protein